MKKKEECLDLVLQTLIENGDSLCVLEVKNIEEYLANKYYESPAYSKLFNDLALNNSDAIQLLEILKEEKYIDFVKGSPYQVFHKNKSNNEIGNFSNSNNELNKWIGKPDRIVITLKGKFFLQEGGYSAKFQRIEKSVNNQIHMRKDLTCAIIEQFHTLLSESFSLKEMFDKSLPLEAIQVKTEHYTKELDRLTTLIPKKVAIKGDLYRHSSFLKRYVEKGDLESCKNDIYNICKVDIRDAESSFLEFIKANDVPGEVKYIGDQQYNRLAES